MLFHAAQLNRSCLPLKRGLFWPIPFHHQNSSVPDCSPTASTDFYKFPLWDLCVHVHMHGGTKRQGGSAQHLIITTWTAELWTKPLCPSKMVCSLPFTLSTDPASNLSLIPPVVYVYMREHRGAWKDECERASIGCMCAVLYVCIFLRTCAHIECITATFFQ